MKNLTALLARLLLFTYSFLPPAHAQIQVLGGCYRYELKYTERHTYNGGHCGHSKTETLEFEGGGVYGTAEECSQSLKNAMAKEHSGDCGTVNILLLESCKCIPAPKPKPLALSGSTPGLNARNATDANGGKDQTKEPKTGAKANENASLCASQTGNIQRLKDKQAALGKGDAATRSLLTSAINQMKNVECGIVLKNVECRNNNCNFAWAVDESNLSDAQAKASVDRFYSAVKEEEKEKAADNAKKAELLELGVEAAFAIANAIDRHHRLKQEKQQSSERFTKIDEDNDGRPETLVTDEPGGGQNLFMDTNGDGKADRVAHIDNSGKTTYESMPPSQQFSMESGTPEVNGDLIAAGFGELESPKTWEHLYKEQSGRPGDDGYMTIVKPGSKRSEPYNYQSDNRNYFVNGMNNRYDEANASAELLANTVGEPLVHIYSESIGIAGDLGQSNAFRNGYGQTNASDNLSVSLTYDLLEGKNVTLYAHSRGAAMSYQTVNTISAYFKDVGAEDKLKNLTVVTVGGYAPDASAWPKGVTVVSIRHDSDPVPALGGNGVLTELPMVSYHSFDTYINEILEYNKRREK